MSDSFMVDVVSAGAGPVGLFLACELRLADVSVLVLEQAEDPHSPLKGLPFGLRGLSALTIEAFYRRGVLQDLATPRSGGPSGGVAGTTAHWMQQPRRPGAGNQTFCARWLVGCDGGRSTVRKVAGFEFVGTEPEFTGYSVEVDMADAAMLIPGRHYTPTGMYTDQKPGTVAMVDFDGGAFHRTEPITVEHVQSVLRHVSGTDVAVTALQLATTWTDRAYHAMAYRNRRVLLAGDAAHIHAPLGGQGLNLGLGDAMNLGWKLASVIRGDAPDTLLDSYTAERHPWGRKFSIGRAPR